MTLCSRMAAGRVLWRITIVSEHDFVCRSITRSIPRLIILLLPAQNSPAILHLLDIASPIGKRELKSFSSVPPRSRRIYLSFSEETSSRFQPDAVGYKLSQVPV